MRLDTFHQFAEKALAQAPDVQTVEPWDRGDDWLRGLRVVFTTGAQFWFGITAAAAPGDKWEGEEVPVEGAPCPVIPLPDLYEDGKVTPLRAVAYLAATVTQSEDRRIAGAKPYAAEHHPGFGVTFHDGAKAFCLVHHTARPGQGISGRAYDLATV